MTEVHAPSALPEGLPGPGETLTGSFRYESERAGRNTPDTASFVLLPPANGFHLDLPSKLDFDGANLTVGLTNDYKAKSMRGAHLMRVGSEMRGAAMGWPFEVSRVRADIVIWDEGRKLATELRLPTSLDLSDVTRAEIGLIGSWGPQGKEKDGPVWVIRGRIDSLAPIPVASEPAMVPEPALAP